MAAATTTNIPTSTTRRVRVSTERPSGRHHERDLGEARLARRMVDALGGLPIVLRLRPEDVGHERLGIAVVEREPARLDLHHDPAPAPAHVAPVGHRHTAVVPCTSTRCPGRNTWVAWSRAKRYTSGWPGAMAAGVSKLWR